MHVFSQICTYCAHCAHCAPFAPLCTLCTSCTFVLPFWVVCTNVHSKIVMCTLCTLCILCTFCTSVHNVHIVHFVYCLSLQCAQVYTPKTSHLHTFVHPLWLFLALCAHLYIGGVGHTLRWITDFHSQPHDSVSWLCMQVTPHVNVVPGTTDDPCAPCAPCSPPFPSVHSVLRSATPSSLMNASWVPRMFLKYCCWVVLVYVSVSSTRRNIKISLVGS